MARPSGKALVSACLGELIVLAPLAVVATPNIDAAPNRGSGDLNRQAFRWTSNPVSTSSKKWSEIPGISGMVICADHGVSVTVSLGASGAPLGLRVLVGGSEPIPPGATRFDPTRTAPAFSYTFVKRLPTGVGREDHRVAVQWRSPTGRRVTLNRADVVAQFEVGHRGPVCSG